MFHEKVEQFEHALERFWATARSYVLARRIEGAAIPDDHAEGEACPASCQINCDLSDKRTFFAWQRNHMANERTFLAWCRTGIALMVFGFMIERFDLMLKELRMFGNLPEMANHFHKTQAIAIAAFFLGIMIISMAGWRFFYIRRLINLGHTEFTVAPDIFLLVAILVTVVMITLSFAFLF